MPLTMLIAQQMDNPYGCPVLSLSMRAHLADSAELPTISSSKGEISLAEATSGKYKIVFMQPEAASTDAGQKLLREMNSKDLIRSVIIDEVHQVKHCKKRLLLFTFNGTKLDFRFTNQNESL